MPSRMQLARDAIKVEQDMIRETVGAQDQVTAAVGGFNRIEFLPSGEINVHPVILPSARLEDLQARLMLFFTGFSRHASAIAQKQVEATPAKTAELARMGGMVKTALEILAAGELSDFGRLLHEAWELKRGLTPVVSTDAIDAMYDAARSAGARGGKLLGAGGGGFMLLFVEPENRAAVLERLKDLLFVPFRFESGGSQIIFYEDFGPNARTR